IAEKEEKKGQIKTIINDEYFKEKILPFVAEKKDYSKFIIQGDAKVLGMGLFVFYQKRRENQLKENKEKLDKEKEDKKDQKADEVK
ncbi:MAG: hypothetical protein EZS28_028280, partial [Streblomastix strix]